MGIPQGGGLIQQLQKEANHCVCPLSENSTSEVSLTLGSPENKITYSTFLMFHFTFIYRV